MLSNSSNLKRKRRAEDSSPKKKAKVFIKEECEKSTLPSIEQTVKGSPKKFSNKKSTGFKKKAKGPLKEEVKVSKLSSTEQAVEGRPKKFSNKKSTEFKKKVKGPLKEELKGSELSTMEQAVEERPKKFFNKKSAEFKKKNNKVKVQSSSPDKKSAEFKKKMKNKKVKVESSSTVESIKEVTDEKKVLTSETPGKKKKKTKKVLDKNLDKTLFVGNLPADITRKGLEKLFEKFGPVVESVRLRGAIPVNIKIPKKVAEIKHKFHDSLHSRKGFVVFKTHEAAKTALSLNGTYVLGHHIIVDKAARSGEKKTYDNSRSIFVGNLPFDVDDEQMWAAFSGCGEVEAVRVIRDPETGAGKGFGYVLFTDKSGQQTALSQQKLEVEGRVVRIKLVEGNQRTPRKNNNAQNFARRQAMKTKKSGDNAQSRKSSKKLIKKHQAEKQKKNIAQAFKKFL